VDERAFVAGSRATWERLAASVETARAVGVAEMAARDLKQMHEDYRQTAADLAYAQTHFASAESTTYLNRLVGRAHGELYGAAPRRAAALWRFLTSGYPRLLRANIKPMALAAGLLFGAVALGYLLAFANYPLARLFLPEMYREAAADPFEQGGQPGDALAMIAPVLSSFITVNNIQVALMAFAGGMSFGVLTVYAMVQNGMLLGVLAGVFAKVGLSLQFWALIVPHGSLELPAIVIAGGAGLMLARALLFPGDQPRMEALQATAPDAARALLGTVPLFLIAGFIEGFVTPRPFDPALKLGLGLVLALVLAAYLGLAGRGDEG
jgi:uncharacterized membrane protein SpoIIM required for sporulation